MELSQSHGTGVATLVVNIFMVFLVYRLYKITKDHIESAAKNKTEFVQSQTDTVHELNNLIDKSLERLSNDVTKEIIHQAKGQGYKQKHHAESLDEVLGIINEHNKQLAELRGMVGASLMIGHKGVK